MSQTIVRYQRGHRAVAGFLVQFFVVAWLSSARAGHPVAFSSSDAAVDTVTVAGTSTLHDWEVESRVVRGRMVFAEIGVGASWETVAAALLSEERTPDTRVVIPVRSLESGRRRMDREMFGALKADKHAAIVYKLNALGGMPDERGTEEAAGAEGRATLRLLAKGELTIGGQTREVEFPVAIAAREQGLTVRGEVALKMTDFDVDPPRLMLGALRVGDAITIRFEWQPDRETERGAERLGKGD